MRYIINFQVIIKDDRISNEINPKSIKMRSGMFFGGRGAQSRRQNALARKKSDFWTAVLAENGAPRVDFGTFPKS